MYEGGVGRERRRGQRPDDLQQRETPRRAERRAHELKAGGGVQELRAHGTLLEVGMRVREPLKRQTLHVARELEVAAESGHL